MKSSSIKKTNIFFYIILFVMIALLSFCMIGEKKETPQKVKVINSNLVVNIKKETNNRYKQTQKKEESSANKK